MFFDMCFSGVWRSAMAHFVTQQPTSNKVMRQLLPSFFHSNAAKGIPFWHFCQKCNFLHLQDSSLFIKDEERLRRGSLWLLQGLQTADLGRNYLLAGTLSTAGINTKENSVFFFWVQASYPPVKVLFFWLACLLQLFPTCCLSSPSAGWPLTSQKVSWQTKDTFFCTAYYDNFSGNQIQIAGLGFFSPSKSFVWHCTYMDGKSLSFFSQPSSSVVHLLKHKCENLITKQSFQWQLRHPALSFNRFVLMKVRKTKVVYRAALQWELPKPSVRIGHPAAGFPSCC